jgi:hypothetical protein
MALNDSQTALDQNYKGRELGLGLGLGLGAGVGYQEKRENEIILQSFRNILKNLIETVKG